MGRDDRRSGPPAVSVEAVPERSDQPGRADPSLARAALLPLSFAVVFGIRYGLSTSLSVAVGAASPLVLLFVASPWLAARSQRGFDQVMAGALAMGKPGLLDRALRRAWWFRVFGPPGLVLERRGLIAAARGDMPAARDAYAAAKKAYERVAPISVELGLADARFETGEDAEAIEGYELALRWDPTLHHARRNLALALVRSGKPADAAPWLDGCPEPSSDDDAHRFRLVRAAAFAATGDRKKAREWRKKAGKPRDDVAKELAKLSR